MAASEHDWIKGLLLGQGAVACGFARAAEVDEADRALYEAWIASGRNGGMEYMERYADTRFDPRLLLEGAESVIAAAFNYYNPTAAGAGGLRWARYALGDDYHDEVRRRLKAVADEIEARSGAACRICVDTAPLRERYWALKAGLGFAGLNNLLIIPGAGTWTVLGFIITTLRLEPDSPMAGGCGECGACVAACPGRALDGRGGMDARRCRSYQTIEYRGKNLPALADRIYGCDICQEVCPWNSRYQCATEIEAFSPRAEILSLTAGQIRDMEQAEFSRIFRRSAIKRAKLGGLKRNLLYCLEGLGGSGEGGDLADGEL